MEYIQGGRVDDLAYLAGMGIDRNKVALELSRIFNQMVFVNGWFHAVSFRVHLSRLLSPQISFRLLLLSFPLYLDWDLYRTHIRVTS